MPQTPDAVVRQWFSEVWNEGDEGAIDRLMDANAVGHGLGPEPMRGPTHFKQFYRTFRSALGDITIDIAHTVVQDDVCVAHCHVRGKHVGDAFGAPATQRPVDFWGMAMIRVRDGKVVEGWNCFDFLSMYQQLGWVKQPVVP